MSVIHSIIDFILHIDTHLAALITQYGTGIYIIMFLIIFIETGFVIMPFLPGDSLLFAAGSFAAIGSLNIVTIIISLIIAAIVGDNLNYFIGKYFGHKITALRVGGHQLVKPEHIQKTEQFFAKYGEKAIIMARFVPIVRTCMPFIAGIGEMRYKTYLLYDVIGGILWISLLTFAGYFFGQQPWIKANFEKVILLIIVVSLLPVIRQALRAAKTNHDNKKAQKKS